jgi:hypothetical protein
VQHEGARVRQQRLLAVHVRQYSVKAVAEAREAVDLLLEVLYELWEPGARLALADRDVVDVARRVIDALVGRQVCHLRAARLLDS